LKPEKLISHKVFSLPIQLAGYITKPARPPGQGIRLAEIDTLYSGERPFESNK